MFLSLIAFNGISSIGIIIPQIISALTLLATIIIFFMNTKRMDTDQYLNNLKVKLELIFTPLYLNFCEQITPNYRFYLDKNFMDEFFKYFHLFDLRNEQLIASIVLEIYNYERNKLDSQTFDSSKYHEMKKSLRYLVGKRFKKLKEDYNQKFSFFEMLYYSDGNFKASLFLLLRFYAKMLTFTLTPIIGTVILLYMAEILEITINSSGFEILLFLIFTLLFFSFTSLMLVLAVWGIFPLINYLKKRFKLALTNEICFEEGYYRCYNNNEFSKSYIYKYQLFPEIKHSKYRIQTILFKHTGIWRKI